MMNEHHHHRDEAKAEANKAQTLASSLSKLSTSSHGVPSGKDFHFNNFDDFKNPTVKSPTNQRRCSTL